MVKKCRLCMANVSSSEQQTLKTPQGTQFFKYMGDDSLATIDIKIISCDSCGLIQTIDEPIIYSENSSASSFVSEKLRSHRVDQALKLFSFQENTIRNILEIGCGDGSFLKSISKISNSMLGIEPSLKTAELAKKNGIDVKSLLVDEETVLTNQDSTFFFLFHVLEHVPNILSFLRGIRNNVVNGALGCIEVPSTEAAFEFRRYGDFMPDHMSYFTSDTLKKALEISGFKILDIERNWNGEHLVAYVQKVSLKTDLNILGDYVTDVSNALISIEEQLTEGKKIAFWGISHHLMPLLTNFRDLLNIELFDSSSQKISRFAPGTQKLIRDSEEITNEEIQFVIISAPRFSDEISENLKSKFPNASELLNGQSILNFRIFQL